MNKWNTVIGLEVHVELSVKTKLFCSCLVTFGAEPNTQCCEICLGLPGTLPSLNKQAVIYAVKAALALNGKISSKMQFERKNYFYPDLPKAWQTSMLRFPICRDGFLEISLPDNSIKNIRIHEIHLEEDAGKLFHDYKNGITQIDYNRCGIPLIEIVTEPDFRTSEEVISFLTELRALLIALDISDCKMQEGSLRVDINLSINKTDNLYLGTRTEMKNLNSFKSIRRAIQNEEKRQIYELESGKTISQESRRWDDATGQSFSMRLKEGAQDYRYFPEPDLPPLILSSKFIENIKKSIPELPRTKEKRFLSEYQLNPSQAKLLAETPSLALFFESVISYCHDPQETVNWIFGPIAKLLNERGIIWDKLTFSAKFLSDLILMVNSNTINRQTAAEVLNNIFGTNISPIEYVKEHHLELITDNSKIALIARQVISQNPKSVTDYLSGKEKALKFLIGQCMHILHGQGDPLSVKSNLLKIIHKTN